MPKFIAYAVDISGTALARYDLATTDEHRRVARIVRT